MKKKVISSFIATGIMLFLFITLMVLIMTVDVKPIGPENSEIGLAGINMAVFDCLGVNMTWYHVTDWLSLVAIAMAIAFAIIGLIQLVKRRSLKKVDYRILLVGLIYLCTVVCYFLFEFVIINYRPIILGVSLASSFPSSTTLITLTIMGTSISLFRHYFKHNKALQMISSAGAIIMIVTTVIGRLLSGVHWFTDILGGVFLSGFFIALYYFIIKLIEIKMHEEDEVV